MENVSMRNAVLHYNNAPHLYQAEASKYIEYRVWKYMVWTTALKFKKD